MAIVTVGICAPAVVIISMVGWSRPPAVPMESGTSAPDSVPRVSVMHWLSSPGEERALDVIRRAFIADGGKWEEEPLPDVSSEQSIATDRILGGKPPEIFQFSVGARLSGLASRGLIARVPMESAVLSSMLPPVVARAASYDGRYVALPFDIMGENWMFYNVKLLHRYGVPIPRTWRQFLIVAEALKEHHVTPLALGGEPWQERILFNDILLGVGGRRFYERIYGHLDQAALSSRTMLEIFRIFGQLRSDCDRNSPGRSWVSTAVLLEQRKAAFEFMGDWEKSQIRSSGFSLGRDIGCALAPSRRPAYIMAVDAFAFSRSSSQSVMDGQRLFARLLLSPQIQMRFNQLRGSIPIRTDLPVEGFDMCARRAMEVIRDPDSQLVSIGLFGLSGGLAGAVEDAISEYWNDPRMSPEQGVILFANAFKTFR